MSQPCIQALLRNPAWSPEKLLVKYGIDFHRGRKYPDLYGFTYDRSAPMESKAVQEATGLLLDASQNWQTVARPFDEFFPYGTRFADTIDWSSAHVEEWLDGTLCMLYFYDGDWHVATRNSPDASVEVGGLSTRPIRELFWETWQAEKFELPKAGYAHLTWLFELTGPENRNVVHYDKPHLTLIGLRHKQGVEVKPEFQDNFPFVQTLRPRSLPEVLESLRQRKVTQCRGFVAVDRYFHRVKFPHPQYMALRTSRVQWSLRQWWEMLRTTEDDPAQFFPDHRRLIVTLTEAVTRLANEIDTAYELVRDIQDQKAYAMAVKDLPYAGILFKLRAGYVKSAREGLQRLPVDKLLHLADLKRESFFAIRGVDDEPKGETITAPIIKDGDTAVNDALGG